MNMNVRKGMTNYVSGARKRYKEYLEAKKAKRKKSRWHWATRVNPSKKHLEKDIEGLMKGADSYAEKAESCRKLSFLSMSNSLRKSAKKQQELADVMSKIGECKRHCNCGMYIYGISWDIY